MKVPWKTAIVVGASSGIGAEVARLLAAAGCRVAIVARREADLEALAEELNHGDARPRVLAYVSDVTEGAAVPPLFQQICRDLGGLDVIFYTAGVMPRIAADEYDFAKDRQTIEVNLLGAMAWLNEAAQRFAVARTGTIVGVSSVAGDRGRRGNPAYCTSKAALNTYLEALRNRVGRFGVGIVTIKPGPVETPMTLGMGKLPGMITVQAAAAAIVSAAARRAHTAYVPGKWRLIMAIIRSIPSPLFKKLNI